MQTLAVLRHQVEMVFVDLLGGELDKGEPLGHIARRARLVLEVAQELRLRLRLLLLLLDRVRRGLVLVDDELLLGLVVIVTTASATFAVGRMMTVGGAVDLLLLLLLLLAVVLVAPLDDAQLILENDVDESNVELRSAADCAAAAAPLFRCIFGNLRDVARLLVPCCRNET